MMDGSRKTRWVRVSRGFMLSAASLFVASMSHVAAGGHAPGLLALSLALAFSLIACTAIVGRTLSLPRLVGGVAVTQLLLHLLFSLDGGTSGAGSIGGATVSAGHHGGVIAFTPAAGTSGFGAEPAMWIAHAIAGALTVVLIRWGHLTIHAVRTLARPFRELVSRTVVACQPLRAPASLLPDPPAVLPALARLCSSSLSYRGPPLLSS